MAGPKQDKARGRFYFAAAWALGIVGGLGLWIWHENARGLESVLVVVCAGLVGGVVFFLYHRGQQHMQVDADTAMAQDPRPPVLYLRSFDDDTANAIEWTLREIMQEEVGPFVAVGRPGDTLPPFGGASRAYLPDDEWKPYVRGMLDRAALVVLRAGRTAGLQWELAQCFQHVSPERVIVLVPAEESVAEDFADLTRKSDVGISFPSIPQKSVRRHRADDIAGLVFFDQSWRGIFVPFESAVWKGSSTHIPTSSTRARERLRTALAPLSKRIGIEIKPPGRNYAAIIIWSWLFLTAVVGVVLAWLAYTGVLK